jgi:hypothetical protein
MKKILLLGASHLSAALLGFALGVYALPILTAPDGPSAEQVADAVSRAEFSGQFRRDLAGSDFLHWGEGTVSVGREAIALKGRIAPGPDYKLYLSPEFVETEAEFNRVKPRMVQVGDVKVFEDFLIPVPPAIDPTGYNTVVVWCESFGEFITSARYRQG